MKNQVKNFKFDARRNAGAGSFFGIKIRSDFLLVMKKKWLIKIFFVTIFKKIAQNFS
jgi:hypothetical protein